MTGDISNADLEWLANDKTSPGPGVGESIDPTKPGPTADRIAELEREIAKGERFIADIELDGFSPAPGFAMTMANLRAELSRLRNEQPELNSRGEPMDHATIARGRKPTDAENAPLRNDKPAVTDRSGDVFADLGVSSPATSPGPQDVREALRAARPFVEQAYLAAASSVFKNCAEFRKKVLEQVDAALAQSDAQPVAIPEGAREALEPTDDMAKTFYSAFDKAGLSDQYQAAKAGLKAVFENLATPTPSSAGLIDAAEIEEFARDVSSRLSAKSLLAPYSARDAVAIEIAGTLRARAADRSAT